MRILIAGEFASTPDEGMRKTACALHEALGEVAVVRKFELPEVRRRAQWKMARSFHPDWILYVPGPSLKSLLLLRALARYCKVKKTACLSLNPEGLGPQWLVRALLPKIVFTHSRRTEERFQDLGATCSRLPVGVDLTKFARSVDTKEALRKRFGLPMAEKVVLHVGHLKRGRNLELLATLPPGMRFFMVASSATAAEPEVVAALEAGGAILWRTFLPDIEAAYAAADVYAFPTVKANNATEIPLSILEALAAGLPVVTTPYGAIPDWFKEAQAVRIVETSQMATALQTFECSKEIARQCAQAFAWSNVASDLLAGLEAPK
jgi:glycosyltransferase involved in cell wall biosynthesis